MVTLESAAAGSLAEAPAAAGRRPAVEVAHLRKTYGIRTRSRSLPESAARCEPRSASSGAVPARVVFLGRGVFASVSASPAG
jgi:hypothetical protein